MLVDGAQMFVTNAQFVLALVKLAQFEYHLAACCKTGRQSEDQISLSMQAMTFQVRKKTSRWRWAWFGSELHPITAASTHLLLICSLAAGSTQATTLLSQFV